MKKTLSFILAFCLLAALAVPLAVFTASADTDGDWTYTVSNGKATITGYNGTATDVVIPDTLGGYPVTKLGVAFIWYYSLSSITIPDSVTSIEGNCFAGCYNLNRVNITDLAAWCEISFGDNPLYYAHNLYLNGVLATDIAIPDGVTNIVSGAFKNCTCLTSITIPEGVTSIGSGAFQNCTNLNSITISESVKMIDNNAFQNCTGLTEVTILGSPAIKTDVFTAGGMPLDLTLYGYRDSSVKAYALANALNFVPLDGEEPEYVYGDCDGDGRIGLSDVTRLAKYVAGWDVTLGPEA